MNLKFTEPTRREALTLAAIAGLTAVLAPKMVFADEAAVAAEIKKLYGDKKLDSGKIKLDVPEIAENGLVVPVNVEVESPMTDKDYVKAVYLFAEGNPVAQIATFRFSPMSPKAAASIRVRLAQSQNIIAIAEMSGGEFYTARKEVKVTIGGCGG